MLELKINNIFFFYIFMEIKKNIFFAWWTLKCANTKLIIFPYQSLLTKFGYFFKTDQNWFDRNYCVLWNFIININIVWKFYLMNRIIHEKLLTSTVYIGILMSVRHTFGFRIIIKVPLNQLISNFNTMLWTIKYRLS
jgi:hypothetical protein